jgi:hypothetical protein
MQEINSRIMDGNWKLSQAEFVSLMGAHTILMTHACTTTGEQINGTDMGDRTCGGTGGKQRMFSWDNSFFQVPSRLYTRRQKETQLLLVLSSNLSMPVIVSDVRHCGA